MKSSDKKVMIVEDDILLLLVEKRLVEHLGYEVIGTASEGDVALEKIKAAKPDIILMDVNLHGPIRGTDVVEQMRLQGNDTPVVFLSAERQPQFVQKAKQLGCIDFLLKPISPHKLEETLNVAFEYHGLSNPNAA